MMDVLKPKSHSDSSTEESPHSKGHDPYSHNWSENLEEYTINIRNSCIAYKWMHNKMAAKHSLINKILEIIITIFGVIISCSIFTTAAYCNSTFEYQIATGIVAAISTILTRIHDNMELSTKSDDHKKISLRWNELCNNIDLQLRLPFRERHEAKMYLQWVQTMYNNLLEISPEISTSIWKSYETQMPDSAASTKKKTIIKQPSVSSSLSTSNLSSSGGGDKQGKYESDKIKYEVDRYLYNSSV